MITLKPLEVLKSACDTKAQRHSEVLVYGGLGGLLTQWLVLGRLTWWDYSWDVIEPITWFVNMGNTIVAYLFFIAYRRDFSYEVLKNLTANKRQMTLYKRVGLDLEAYARLTDRRRKIEQEIEQIRVEYD
jgi:hypothetical protein